jgi:pilus assembly protein CpaC
MRLGWGVALALVVAAGAAQAQTGRDRIRIPVGRAEVVTSNDDVRTVAIAEPKIADAAVGSARTVVVNAKSPGVTTLVVYSEGARYKVYDIEVYVPNGTKQVALHVRVAEVNDNAAREFGFDWFGEAITDIGFFRAGILTAKISPYTDSPPSLTVGPNTDGFVHYEHSSGTWFLQSAWKALEERGDLRTLANPTLIARSGEKANFLAGGEIAIPVVSNATSGTINVEWKEYGVKVEFTPTVEEDGSITLKVQPEVSQLDFTNGTKFPTYSIPSLITRRTMTTVNLKPGEHLAIGGLKQTDKLKNVTRVPFLGQIPLLGFFFTHSRWENVNRELLVVVSPDVVEAAASMPPLPTDRPQQ